jgi:hypothetical protein
MSAMPQTSIYAIRSQDITGLRQLINGEQMTLQQIAEQVMRKPVDVRNDLSWLLMNGDICRLCGLGAAPAKYFLPPRGVSRSPRRSQHA